MNKLLWCASSVVLFKLKPFQQHTNDQLVTANPDQDFRHSHYSIKILKTAPSLYSTEVECNASNASLALVIIWLLRLLLHARASGALWRRKEVKHQSTMALWQDPQCLLYSASFSAPAVQCSVSGHNQLPLKVKMRESFQARAWQKYTHIILCSCHSHCLQPSAFLLWYYGIFFLPLAQVMRLLMTCCTTEAVFSQAFYKRKSVMSAAKVQLQRSKCF